jgi:hypothetical protein
MCDQPDWQDRHARINRHHVRVVLQSDRPSIRPNKVPIPRRMIVTPHLEKKSRVTSIPMSRNPSMSAVLVS